MLWKNIRWTICSRIYARLRHLTSCTIKRCWPRISIRCIGTEKNFYFFEKTRYFWPRKILLVEGIVFKVCFSPGYRINITQRSCCRKQPLTGQRNVWLRCRQWITFEERTPWVGLLMKWNIVFREEKAVSIAKNLLQEINSYTKIHCSKRYIVLYSY